MTYAVNIQFNSSSLHFVQDSTLLRAWYVSYGTV